MSIIDSVLSKIKTDITAKDVIEVACGRADLSVAMSPYANAVQCVDLVEFRLNPAISKCKNVRFSVMDASKMTYADGEFDVAVIYNAAYHIKQDFEKILAECLRIVKKGGAVYVISTFSIDKPVIEDVAVPILRNMDVDFKIEKDKNAVTVKIFN